MTRRSSTVCGVMAALPLGRVADRPYQLVPIDLVLEQKILRAGRDLFGNVELGVAGHHDDRRLHAGAIRAQPVQAVPVGEMNVE